jgi:hypothetical protein
MLRARDPAQVRDDALRMGAQKLSAGCESCANGFQPDRAQRDHKKEGCMLWKFLRWMSPWLSSAVCASAAGVIIASSVNLAFFAPAAEASPSKPLTDWSWYVETTSGATVQQLGCNQGQFDAAHNTNSLVFLDFGGQNSSGTGTTEINGTPVSNLQIETLAEDFANGYYICTGSDTTTVLTLAVGTNNSAYDISSSGGKAWAGVVQAVTQGTQSDASQVSIWGANDIEPSWSSWSAAKSWVDGYSNNGGGLYLDYGSADGCSQTTDTNTTCNNRWTQSDVYYVAWGALSALSSPEIYYTSLAAQWTQISRYGAQYSQGPIYFEGPLDEYDLDNSTLTSSAAWNALTSDLNQYAATQPTEDMPYSLEVHSAS